MHVRVLTKICMVRSVLSRAPAEEGLAAACRAQKCEMSISSKKRGVLGKILRLIINSCAFEIRANMNENIVMKFCTFLKVLVGPMLRSADRRGRACHRAEVPLVLPLRVRETHGALTSSPEARS